MISGAFRIMLCLPCHTCDPSDANNARIHAENQEQFPLSDADVAVQILNWKPGQAQVWGSDISRGWTQKPRQARVTVKC